MAYAASISARKAKGIGLALAVAGALVASGGGPAAPANASGAVPRQLTWQEAECIPAVPGEARTSNTCGATLEDGWATPPPGAPLAVKQMIHAANHIDGRPYVWGGGHVSFHSRGYDCSGAVSYVLHAAGLLDYTMVSGELQHWGEPGIGRWVTIYANPEHTYMEIAGLRFDTRDDLPGVTGPRWHTTRANPQGFASRHPAGL